jgi:hypothetical protein
MMAIPLRQRDRRPTTGRPAAESAATRPQLAVVEGRRRVAWFAVSLSVMIGGVMMGALALHTRIAERQLQIDHLERSVRQSQVDFDVLSAQRAELRSPTGSPTGLVNWGWCPATRASSSPSTR